MSKPKQWKQGRELKHADVWQENLQQHDLSTPDYEQPYPQEAEPDGRLWVGSGDSQ